MRPAVQVGLAFAVGVAAFGLAAVVSPHLRDLDGDALFVLGIFILVALLVTEIAARTGLTPASVRVNLHRGMKLLREKLHR